MALTPRDRLTTPRLEFEQRPEAPQRIAFHIATTQLQTTASTLYTASDDRDFIIRHMWAANIAATAHTITVHLVPDGETAGDANAICKGFSIAANTPVWLDFLSGYQYGYSLQPGMSLVALADANDVVNMGGWGQAYSGGKV